VPRDLREKFDRQRYRLSKAIRNGELIEVQTECERMLVAWAALDTHATKVGAEPIAPEVWEVTLEGGTVAAIVRDSSEAHHVVATGRATVVYTLDEIGRMLSRYTGVMKLKQTYAGATVTRVDKTIGDPLDAIRQATGFDDPIDDLFEPQSVN
jgi:hypothetical protein